MEKRKDLKRIAGDQAEFIRRVTGCPAASAAWLTCMQLWGGRVAEGLIINKVELLILKE